MVKLDRRNAHALSVFSIFFSLSSLYPKIWSWRDTGFLFQAFNDIAQFLHVARLRDLAREVWLFLVVFHSNCY